MSSTITGAPPAKSWSLPSMSIFVYQSLRDKNDSSHVIKLFDTLLTELQDPGDDDSFRLSCDLMRLFADHAVLLANTKTVLVASTIQILCQLIVQLGTEEANKEHVYSLIMCLEDWCLAVGKEFLLHSVDHLSTEDESSSSSASPNTPLITIVLRSLENVSNHEPSADETGNKSAKSSLNPIKATDMPSTNRQPPTRGVPVQRGRAASITDNIGRKIGASHEVPSNTGNNTESDNNLNPSRGTQDLGAIRLACKVSHQKLITYLGHFPLNKLGAATVSCCVTEADYLTEEQDMADFKNTPSIILFVIDQATLITFIGAPENQRGLHQPVHLIIRNLCGKYSWDAACIDRIDQLTASRIASGNKHTSDEDNIVIDPESFQRTSHSSMKYDSDFNDDGASSSSLSSRSSNRDCISDLISQLNVAATLSSSSSNNSSSLSTTQRNKRNPVQSVSNPRLKMAQAEETMIALLTNQRFQELNYCEKSDEVGRVTLTIGSSSPAQSKRDMTLDSKPMSSDTKDPQPVQISFEQCRQLAQQLGYLSWEKRSKVDTLAKSQRLLREIKNLDAQPTRETHKIAVIYVAAGQEDKNSILMNSSGSNAFEDFVAGLGWEVNLASHLGYKGGLQSKSTGETSTYFSNATIEIMFHVSTRIAVSSPPDDESLNRKLRHLGNDEIHIIWSEHSQDYRRGIIPTEFGDVIIAIYPLQKFNGYYRVQILSRQEVPPFGPLFDSCVVYQSSLAALVRATAINASRAKRLKLPYYQTPFEERSRLIETIVQNHKERLSFEDFAMQLYSKGELKGVTAASRRVNSRPEKATSC